MYLQFKRAGWLCCYTILISLQRRVLYKSLAKYSNCKLKYMDFLKKLNYIAYKYIISKTLIIWLTTHLLYSWELRCINIFLWNNFKLAINDHFILFDFAVIDYFTSCSPDLSVGNDIVSDVWQAAVYLLYQTFLPLNLFDPQLSHKKMAELQIPIILLLCIYSIGTKIVISDVLPWYWRSHRWLKLMTLRGTLTARLGLHGNTLRLSV